MEFPISRERLQNYRANEVVAVETKKILSKEFKQICKDVETKVLTTNERKYFYRISDSVKYGELRPQISLEYSSGNIQVNPVPCLKPLLETIKNTFPDSTVTIDPFEMYIVIDCS